MHLCRGIQWPKTITWQNFATEKVCTTSLNGMRVIVSRESQLHRYLAESGIEPQKRETEALRHAPDKAAPHANRIGLCQIPLLATCFLNCWQNTKALLILSATEAIISELDNESNTFGSSFRDDIKFAIVQTDQLSSPFLNALSTALKRPLSIQMMLARDNKQLLWTRVASIISDTPHRSLLQREVASMTSLGCIIVLCCGSIFFAISLSAIAVGSIGIYMALRFRYSDNSRQFLQSLRAFHRSYSALKEKYTETLDTIKGIQLVSRGHRLGSLLPPIGRMEQVEYDAQSTLSMKASFFTFRCASMRRQLGYLNESIARWIRCFADQRTLRRETIAMEGRKDDMEHPSLLIAALDKRFCIGSQLLEAGIHRSLVRFVVDSIRNLLSGQRKDANWIDQLQALQSRLEVVAQEMREWYVRLDVSLKLVQGTTSNTSDINVKKLHLQYELLSSKTNELEDVQMALKTLNALVWSCRSVLSCQQGDKSLELVRLGKQMSQVASEMQLAVEAFTTKYEPKMTPNLSIQERGVSNVTKELNYNTQTDDGGSFKTEDAEHYLMVFQGTSLGHDTFDLERYKEEQVVAVESTSRSTYHQELKDILTSRLILSSKDVRIKDLDQIEVENEKQKQCIHNDHLSLATREECIFDGKEIQRELAKAFFKRQSQDAESECEESEVAFEQVSVQM